MKHKILRRAALVCLILALLALLPSLWVRLSTRHRIEPETLPQADYILVLGCGIREDGSPSTMLRERLETGVKVYQAGYAPTLLMSGSTRPGHDELSPMRETAEAAGVPESAILCDTEGHSTSLSFRNLRQVDPDCTVIIVTHRYHMYRAVYLARALGLNAYGVPCEAPRHLGQAYRDLREVLARDKDFVQCLLWLFHIADPAV